MCSGILYSVHFSTTALIVIVNSRIKVEEKEDDDKRAIIYDCDNCD